MEKILITGSSGLLGSKLVKLASANYEVIPTYRTHELFPNSIEMDVTSAPEVSKVFREYRPDIIIHTAAETSVDKCEVNKHEAAKVNIGGTENIVRSCKDIGSKLVFISTDYVFDGEKGLYTEEDSPNPVNYYGFTKLEGERRVRAFVEDFLIIRSSVLYGWHEWKLNFATWVISSLRKGERIQVVSDHYNSPTFADNLAEAILKLINERGIYHVAGSERTSRFDFAVKIAREFGLDEGLIEPVKMNELKAWIAKRPRDSSLNVSKAQRVLKGKLFNVEEGLKRMRESK